MRAILSVISAFWVASTILAGGASAAETIRHSKFYEMTEVHSSSCDGHRERMLENADREAEAYCSDDGGVRSADFDLEEDKQGHSNYFCRVYGEIVCNGRERSKSSASSPSPKSPAGSIYEHVEHTGQHKDLGVGTYDFRGTFWENRISSLSVARGYTMLICDLNPPTPLCIRYWDGEKKVMDGTPGNDTTQWVRIVRGNNVAVEGPRGKIWKP